MNSADWAEEVARKLLEPALPRRWRHTQGVAAQARSLRPVLGNDAELLEAAAWLHDIGYSPELVDSGFHPLDGARFLRDAHYADELTCRLVAYHSCAIIEAEERGLDDALSAEFQPANPLLSNALIYCDMTTSPDGRRMPVGRRIPEIKERYGTGHVVTRAIERSSPNLIAAVNEVNSKIRRRETDLIGLGLLC